jgi:hypothetical protein
MIETKRNLINLNNNNSCNGFVFELMALQEEELEMLPVERVNENNN